MKYYHLTYKDRLESILKNGLVIDDAYMKNRNRIGDTEQAIFLTDFDNIPYWILFLKPEVILEIDIDNSISLQKCIEEYEYNYYSEYKCFESIPTKYIRIATINVSNFYLEGANKDICENIIYDISWNYKEMIQYYDRINHNHPYDPNINAAVKEDLICTFSSLINVIENSLLNFSCLSDEDMIDILVHNLSEQGVTTFCDFYENTGEKLFNYLSNIYPKDDLYEYRRFFCDFINTKLPICNSIDTGRFDCLWDVRENREVQE